MIIKLANVLRSLKASALADGIIAAKRGTQGRSPVLLSPFVNHVNKTVRESAVLRNSGLFKGNRLNVKRLKTDLQVLNGLESSVAGAQVALPVGAYANSYHNALRDGYDNSEAHARGRRSGALGL